MTHHLIQPILRAVLHTGELLQPLPPAGAGRGDGFACKALFSFDDCRFNAQELLSPVGGLHHKGAAHRLTVDGHVLVSGEQDVKIQLLTQPVGHVLVGGGQHTACGQIPLEASVIDTQRHVHLISQLIQRRTRGRNGIADGNAGQVLRPLPDVHIVGNDADNADPQPVFQRVDPGGEANARPVPPDVLANAAGAEGVEIAVQIRHAVVEIMISQRHIVIAAAVHHFRKPAGIAQCIVAEGTQR